MADQNVQELDSQEMLPGILEDSYSRSTQAPAQLRKWVKSVGLWVLTVSSLLALNKLQLPLYFAATPFFVEDLVTAAFSTALFSQTSE